MNHTFQVEGMTCGHCEMAVQKAIVRFDSEANVIIDRTTGKVEIESDKAREQLAHIISEEGYFVAAT
jgi:copper chaperone